MQHNWKKPSLVYLLPEGWTGNPRKLTPDEIDAHFEQHEDTGWEPKLRSLYDMIECELIDCRSLPGLGTLWFDDEGRLSGRKQNSIASSIYNDAYRTREGILGNALLVPTDDAPPDVVEAAISLLWKMVQRSRNTN
jgi:hypothetical protein